MKNSLDSMIPLIVFLGAILWLLQRTVTSMGPFHCRPIQTSYGRAVEIKVSLGTTAFQNSVTGKIVCNGGDASLVQTRILPSMYCPDSFGGSLMAVKRVIDDVCRGTGVGQDVQDWQLNPGSMRRTYSRSNSCRMDQRSGDRQP